MFSSYHHNVKSGLGFKWVSHLREWQQQVARRESARRALPTTTMAASTSRAPFSELNTIAPRVRGKDASSTTVAGRSASSDLKQLLAGVLSLQCTSTRPSRAWKPLD